ncbi:MAG: putative rRNA maturation factor [Frankiales bacterium]|jgi:probable rRNA maturation factor|nr:putative rRNA maturation factor [Frankiales bacterium]
MSIEIANESGAPVDERELIALARHVLSELKVHPLAELSVLLVDINTMEQLHKRWMNESGPTDVLAFPMDELPTGRHDEDPGPQPALLGDVVLCPAVAERQAQEAGHDTEDELHLLCTHGVLHLLGYDHGDAEEEREMFAIQARVLDSWRRRVRQRGTA